MLDPSRPTAAQISLQAIEKNYKAIRSLLRPGTKFLGVVKADAYGLGAVPVAKRLVSSGAEFLGVAQVEEGAELRRGDVKAPILVMQGVRPEEAGAVLENSLAPVVFGKDVVDALSARGREAGRKIPVHVKVDTGMTRLGVLPDEVPGFLDYLKGLPGITIEGICSHFAIGEDPQNPLTVSQKQQFARLAGAASAKAGGALLRHLANSAATILDAETHYDMVRIGITLYGEHPAQSTQGRVSLEPALSWRTYVAQIKNVPAGASVSYGAMFQTKRPSRIGVLPVGYADGYPRVLSNKAEVIVGGGKCPVVGIVCMDLIMADLTDAPGVKEGDEAVLLGGQGSARVSAADLAEKSGTIAYEILCGISKRVPRLYG